MSTENNFVHLGQNLEIHYVSCDELTLYQNNPRTHSKKQIAQLMSSINAFGFTNPLLIDDQNMILAGHGRIEAAKLNGITELPVIRLAHLSDAQKRAYIIADNKLAENAGWDDDLLKIEIQHLISLDHDFDITLTGFELAEIDTLIFDDISSGAEIIPDPSGPIVSSAGDIWLMGNHRLLCGNALSEASFAALMEQEKADLVFSDPPYNVPINKHVCGNGSIKHEEFAMASGEMSESEFTQFLKNAFKLLEQYSRCGSIHYICMDWRHIGEITNAGNEVYTELKNVCVWNKDNGGMGSLYRSKHELVFVFKHGTSPHVNNVELGKHGRYRTNIWDYPGVNTIQNDSDLNMHPTVKPVSLIADALLDCSKRNDIVLDCFGGSGSTLMAAEQVSRRARLIEIDPKYVDVCIKRWQDKTGRNATNQGTGISYNETLNRKISS